MKQHEWLLERNCSLSPRQLGLAYGIQCFLSFMIAALVLTLHGAWLVLAFAIIEMAAVAWAFLHYARHATDHEHISLTDSGLLVERVEAGRVLQTLLDPRRTRVVMPASTRDLISLEARDIRIEVGRFVTGARRSQIARELGEELQVGLHSCA